MLRRLSSLDGDVVCWVDENDVSIVTIIMVDRGMREMLNMAREGSESFLFPSTAST